MKKRSVSSTLHAPMINSREKGVGEAGTKPRSSQGSTDKTGSVLTLNQQAAGSSGAGTGVLGSSSSSAQQDTSTDRADSVSSEEECWDELFGFKEGGSNHHHTTTTGSQGTESLDLALPMYSQSHHSKRKTLSTTGFPTESRLALSSDRMPQLLSYLSIVKEQCKECLVELKSQTV